MSSGPLVTAGEFYLDLIFYDLERPPQLGEELKTDRFAFSPGGGAAITAAAAARLGRPSRLATVWGDSPLDAAARAALEGLGVDWGPSRVREGDMSGLSVAVSTRADRYFLTHPGANRFLEEYLLSPEGLRQLASGRHVHFALAAADWQPFGQLVEELRRRGVTTSWDMGWDPEAAAADGFRELCLQLDVLFHNEPEALRYTGSESLEQALARLSTGRNTVVVKRGRKGALAVANGSEPVPSPALEVMALETTGAGDAFNGGFLDAWMGDRPLAECLQAGNVCGGLSTRAAGGVAGLPSRKEFETWRRPQ